MFRASKDLRLLGDGPAEEDGFDLVAEFYRTSGIQKSWVKTVIVFCSEPSKLRMEPVYQQGVVKLKRKREFKSMEDLRSNKKQVGHFSSSHTQTVTRADMTPMMDGSIGPTSLYASFG
jgi:hypothetical protein